MKKGDRVKIIDHSGHFDLDVSEGRLKQCNASGGYHTGDELIVIATDCILPSQTGYEPYINDTIVFNNTKGVFFFTQQCFLRKISICPNCGQEFPMIMRDQD